MPAEIQPRFINDIRNTRFKLVRSIRFGTYTDILIQDIPQTQFN